jgi:hypothetical protein
MEQLQRRLSAPHEPELGIELAELPVAAQAPASAVEIV